EAAGFCDKKTVAGRDQFSSRIENGNQNHGGTGFFRELRQVEVWCRAKVCGGRRRGGFILDGAFRGRRRNSRIEERKWLVGRLGARDERAPFPLAASDGKKAKAERGDENETGTFHVSDATQRLYRLASNKPSIFAVHFAVIS